ARGRGVSGVVGGGFGTDRAAAARERPSAASARGRALPAPPAPGLGEKGRTRREGERGCGRARARDALSGSGNRFGRERRPLGEDVLEGCLEADGQRAGEDRRLAQSRDLDARREWEPFA